MEFILRMMVVLLFPFVLSFGAFIDLHKAEKPKVKILCATMIMLCGFVGGFCFNYLVMTSK